MKKIFLLCLTVSGYVSSQNLILDGRTIQLDQTQNAIIDPVSGNITLRSSDGNLTCSGTPPSLTLSANPTAVDSGGSSTITWNVSNATSCSKSGDWSGTLTGSDVTDGSHSEVVTNITSSSTYSMQCSNGFGTTSVQSVNVTLNGNPACTDQPPILSGNEDRSIVSAFGGPDDYDGTYNDWLGLASTETWPGRLGNQINFSLDRNKYIAAQFNTGNENLSGRTTFTTPGNFAGPPSTATTMAISECPGDFTTHLDQARCLVVSGPTPTFQWSTDPSANGAIKCKLEKNKTYYLNIVHSNTTANGYQTSGCSSSFCGGIMSHSLD